MRLKVYGTTKYSVEKRKARLTLQGPKMHFKKNIFLNITFKRLLQRCMDNKEGHIILE